MKTAHKYLETGAFEKGVQDIPPTIERMLEAEMRFYTRALQGHERVLDIGTGTGRTASYLSDHASHVITIDTCAYIARKSAETLRSKKKITVMIADGTQLPFQDGIFDTAVFGMSTLGTLDIETQIRLLREVSRVTKGPVLGSVYEQSAAPFQKEWYERTGVKVSKIDDDYVYIDELGFRSQRFSEKGLGLLLAQTGLTYRIETLSDIGLGYEVRRA